MKSGVGGGLRKWARNRRRLSDSHRRPTRLGTHDMSLRDNDKSKVIEYWWAVEVFSPQRIAKADSGRRDAPVYDLTKPECLPWDLFHPLQTVLVPEGKARRYSAYCGVYNLQRLREILEERLGANPEVFDERVDGESCLFSMRIAEDGRQQNPICSTWRLAGRSGGSTWWEIASHGRDYPISIRFRCTYSTRLALGFRTFKREHDPGIKECMPIRARHRP